MRKKQVVVANNCAMVEVINAAANDSDVCSAVTD